MKEKNITSTVNDATKEYVVYNCERLNIRSEPKKDAPVLFITTAGTRLNVKEVENEWAHVFTKDRKPKEGYAMVSFLKEI